MIDERTVTIDASDPNPGRIDRSRFGKLNPADTEPRPPIPPGDSTTSRVATLRQLRQLRQRLAGPARRPAQ